MSNERVIIEREVFIAAPPETVFRFLVNPELMTLWFGISHKLKAHLGGIFRVEVSVGNVAYGTFTEVIPNRRVAFTWGWETADAAIAALKPGTSLVEIDLEPKEEGTLLRLCHSRLPDDLAAIHGDRWSNYLVQLAAAAGAAAGEFTNQPDQGKI
jgi:uncharacterized protein YndB with AHSA1/START domain